MRALRLSMILAVLLAAHSLVAQDPCADLAAKPQTAEAASLAVERLDTRDCLGGVACRLPVCDHFRDWHATKDGPGVLALLTEIRGTVTQAGVGPNIDRMAGKIDEWKTALSQKGAGLSTPAQWQRDNGGFFLQTPAQIDLEADLAARCPSACEQAFREATAIVTAATLVSRINNDLLEGQRKALQEFVTGLDQRWDDYFNRAPGQFPWELAVNSAIYRKHEHRGFNEPPSWQLIVFHPAAAYEYSNEATDKFKAALALDAIGYFRGHLGAALAAAWSDQSDAKKMGVGVTLHWEGKVTVGVIRHGGAGATSILVSPHIEKYLTAGVKKLREVITKSPE